MLERSAFLARLAKITSVSGSEARSVILGAPELFTLSFAGPGVLIPLVPKHRSVHLGKRRRPMLTWQT